MLPRSSLIFYRTAHNVKTFSTLLCTAMEDPGTDVLLEKIDKLLDVPYTRLEKLQSLYASLEKAPPLPHGTPAELPLPSIRIRLQIYHYCIPRKQVIEVSSPRFHTAWPFVDRTLDFDAPVVSMTVDPNFNAESMRIYLECSRQMLSVVKQLQMFKSLDTTWYNSAVLVMAITTTLFAQWEKRNETSAGDLAALRVEMDQWLNIISDVGALLGMPNLRFQVKLANRIRFWIETPRSSSSCH